MHCDQGNPIDSSYGVYAPAVMAAILVFQSNETAAMSVYQTNPVGVQLFSYVNTYFCSNKFAWLQYKWVNTLCRIILINDFNKER